MKKLAVALLLSVLATTALAQGGPSGGGPGPGPAPDPWVQNGSAISYNGCVLVPSSVSGGCKGNGTINATGVYVQGTAISGVLATAPIVASAVVGGARTISLNVDSNFSIVTNNLALASGGVSYGAPTGGAKGAGTINALELYVNGVAVTGAGITQLTGDVTAAGPGVVPATLATAQPGAHTWAATQTFTVAPVFTDQNGSRTALGLGTAAVQNVGTSGANVPLLNGANTWGAVQTLPSPAFTGTVTGANTVPLGVLAQSAANTMLGNWTGSIANVAANAMPSCPDTGGNHLNYVSGTGITCGTGLGNGITALTGDVVATGPGSVAATIQPNAVTYAKFQQVAASSLIGNPTGVGANAQAVSLGATLAFSGTALQTDAGTGDVTWSANSFATTLATVNANVGSFGSSTAIPTFTVNGKGLITAASTAAVVAPAGTLTGTTLASNVVTSSLTSVGTLTGGATGAGFTVALSISTISGTLPGANFGPLTGDVTTSSYAATIATHAVTYAKFQQVAASSLVGNPTGVLANAQDVTIDSTLGFSGTTLLCTTATASQIGCARPDNTTITIAGGVLTAVGSVATSVQVGVTTITSGTGGRVLYDNAGVLGEMTTTGSGTVLALATSPSLTTPILGVATATSINKVAITAPATSATLTIADGKTLTASNTLTFTGTDSSSIAFGGGGTVTYTIASGAKALATGAIGSGACTSAQTDTATGAATTDAVAATFSSDPTATTGYSPTTNGMLTIIAWPTLNTVNFKVCNNTFSSITPGAVTINWRVTR